MPHVSEITVFVSPSDSMGFSVLTVPALCHADVVKERMSRGLSAGGGAPGVPGGLQKGILSLETKVMHVGEVSAPRGPLSGS